MNNIEAYVAFARLIELGSFSTVAREMRISQSTVSKHIAGLEEALGVSLFVRTTRHINPTAEALQLQVHVQRMLESLEEVQAVARGQHPEVSGLLRIAAPVSLGRHRILPLLQKFLDLFPLVSVEVILSDALPDLIKDGLELAITFGDSQPNSMIVRLLRRYDRLVVASPAYLEAKGTPSSPVDLDGHEMVLPTNLVSESLEFDSELGRQTVRLRGRLRTNNDEVAYHAALDSRGIAIVPSWLVTHDVNAGRLTIVLQDYYLAPVPVNLIYPQARFLSRRARSFIDYMVSELTRSDPKTSARH